MSPLDEPVAERRQPNCARRSVHHLLTGPHHLAEPAVIGLDLLTLWDDRGTLEPWIGPLQEMLEDGTLRPIVSDEVPFDNAAEAHRIITERRNVGKVVLIP